MDNLNEETREALKVLKDSIAYHEKESLDLLEIEINSMLDDIAISRKLKNMFDSGSYD